MSDFDSPAHGLDETNSPPLVQQTRSTPHSFNDLPRDLFTAESPTSSTHPIFIAWEPFCSDCDYLQHQLRIHQQSDDLVKTQLREVSCEVTALKTDISELNQHISTLHLELHSQNEQIATLEETNTTLQDQLRSRTEHNESLLQSVKSLECQSSQLTQDLLAKTDHNTTLNNQLQIQSEQNAVLDAQNVALDTVLHSQTAQIAILNDQLSAQIELNFTLHDQLNQAKQAEQDQHQQHSDQISLLNAKIDELTKQVELAQNDKLIAKKHPYYAFLTGKGQSLPDNHFLCQAVAHYNHNFTDLDNKPGFIQWFFPTTEQSAYNSHAKPISWEEMALFRGNPVIQHNMIVLFNMMLEFWGFEIQPISPSSSTQTLPTTPLSPPLSLSDQFQTDYNTQQVNTQLQADFELGKSTNNYFYPVPSTPLSQLHIHILPHRDFQVQIDRFSHLLNSSANRMRITRVLTSLRLVGLDNFASAFYNALLFIIFPQNQNRLCPPHLPAQLCSDMKSILDRLAEEFLKKDSSLHKFWAPIFDDKKTIKLLDKR